MDGNLMAKLTKFVMSRAYRKFTRFAVENPLTADAVGVPEVLAWIEEARRAMSEAYDRIGESMDGDAETTSMKQMRWLTKILPEDSP